MHVQCFCCKPKKKLVAGFNPFIVSLAGRTPSHPAIHSCMHACMQHSFVRAWRAQRVAHHVRRANAAHVVREQLIVGEQRRAHWNRGLTHHLEALIEWVRQCSSHEHPSGRQQRVAPPSRLKQCTLLRTSACVSGVLNCSSELLRQSYRPCTSTLSSTIRASKMLPLL